jgi:signal transduction histidine kinase/ActR/RegA family two-component response regulator/predicted RNA-binding protein with RPS1 domain
MPTRNSGYAINQRVTVTVEEARAYGLFVLLDEGTHGYIRRRELSPSGDVDPRSLFRVGQTLEAVIIEPPASAHLLELSHVRTLPDPWQSAKQKYQVGALVKASVKSVRTNGIVVEVESGIQGFIPQAELTNWIEAVDATQLWWKDDQIEAVISRIDPANHSLVLSIRQRLQQRAQAQAVMNYLEQHAQPATAEPTAAAPSKVSLVDEGAPQRIGCGQRILVVEDSQLLRQQLVNWLNNRGFCAEGVTEVEMAKERLQAPAWLLLVDIDLDGENGLHLAEWVNQAQPETWVAVMSTSEWLAQERAALARLQLVEVFSKPLDANEIERLLVDLCNATHSLSREGNRDLLDETTVSSPNREGLGGSETDADKDAAPVQQLSHRLAQLVRSSSAELGVIFQIDPASHKVAVVARSGVLALAAASLQPLLDSPVKDVINERKALFNNRVSQQSPARYRHLLAAVPFESCIGLPLQVWGEVHHVLFLFHRSPEAFRRAQLRDIQASAGLCASSLEHLRLEERLQANAGRLLSGELAAALAHEVTNKISGLELGLRNLLSDVESFHHELSAEPAQQRLSATRQEIDSLLDAQRDLKETVALFQRVIRSDVSDVVEINEVIHNAERLVRSLARRHGIKIDLRLAPDSPALRGSSLQLQQVFVNLLLNAVQQMAQNRNLGKAVEITTRQEVNADAKQLIVRFADQGPGIHRSLWETIFNLGYSTRPGGSGLGLSIARSLVKANGGALYVEESNIPLGTTFVVALPLDSR